MVDAIQLYHCKCSWCWHCNFYDCDIFHINITKKRWCYAQLVGKYVSLLSTSMFNLCLWIYLSIVCGRTQQMPKACHSSLYLNQDLLDPQNGHNLFNFFILPKFAPTEPMFFMILTFPFTFSIWKQICYNPNGTLYTVVHTMIQYYSWLGPLSLLDVGEWLVLNYILSISMIL